MESKRIHACFSDLVNSKQAYYLAVIVRQLFHSLSTKASVMKSVYYIFPDGTITFSWVPRHSYNAIMEGRNARSVNVDGRVFTQTKRTGSGTLKTKRGPPRKCLAYQSPCLIIVFNYHRAAITSLVLLFHELLRHRVSIENIVTAASPLELVVFSDGKCLVG